MISIPYKNRSMCSQLIEFQQGKKTDWLKSKSKRTTYCQLTAPWKLLKMSFFMTQHKTHTFFICSAILIRFVTVKFVFVFVEKCNPYEIFAFVICSVMMCIYEFLFFFQHLHLGQNERTNISKRKQRKKHSYMHTICYKA